MAEENGGQGAAGAGGAAGGAGNTGGAAGAGDGSQGAPAPQGQQGAGGGSETAEQTIARLTAENVRLEREKSDARVAKEGALKDAARKSQLYALAQAFQVADLGTEAAETIETLQQKLTGRVSQADTTAADRADAREARVELAIFRMAASPDVQVDAGRLTNSRSFYEATKNLDPADSGFEQALKTAIKAEVTKDPTLQVGFGTVGGPGGTLGTGAQASGAQNHGGSGGGMSQVTQEQFDAMTMVEKNRLFLTDREQFARLAG